jgi:small subunit ribosomal protein S13
MARIANITLPNDKQIYIGLTAVYGIGINTAKHILTELKIDAAKRVKDLTTAEEQQLNDYIATHMMVEGNLQRIVQGNIKRLKDINSYRGLRHKAGLPVRGQRTRTNARTRKGKAIAVGGAQPKAATKT